MQWFQEKLALRGGYGDTTEGERERRGCFVVVVVVVVAASSRSRSPAPPQEPQRRNAPCLGFPTVPAALTRLQSITNAADPLLSPGFPVAALPVAMLHDLCHCTHSQLSGSSSREEDMMNEMAGDLTQSQQDTLAKFREILAEQGLLRKRDDDHTLLRFLRARGFDIAKAKAMYEAMLDWRKEIGADSIRETFEFPERKVIRDLYPHFHHKTDKLGRPVYIERLGQLNVDELLKITTMDRMLLYHVKEWEVLIDWKFPACSKKAGTCISQSLTILDLKGVTMKHMSKQVRHFIQKITKVDQDYYPEYLGKMFIVNAPTAFKAIWAMIKPWLDKRTQKKIELHGGHFSSKLLELVDSENLPEFLGGSCTCLGGCENSDAGPWNEALYDSDVRYDELVKAAV